MDSGSTKSDDLIISEKVVSVLMNTADLLDQQAEEDCDHLSQGGASKNSFRIVR